MGSDVAEGELLLHKGQRLGPAEMGLLALSARQQVKVYRRPRVCVLSTGDELIDPLAPLPLEEVTASLDAVVDTNRPTLLALLRSAGAEPVDCGIAADGRQTLIEAVERALAKADVLVVSGGVSMGEKDLLKEVLQSHFHFGIHFGRVFMKPGLPTTFASGPGPADGRPKLVFGLPGNPVSALVTGHLFVLPQLRRIGGQEVDWESARIAVKLAHPIERLDPRPEYRRVLLKRGANAIAACLPEPELPLAECIWGSQLSSRLLSARSANLLLELPAAGEKMGRLEAGATVMALVIGPL